MSHRKRQNPRRRHPERPARRSPARRNTAPSAPATPTTGTEPEERHPQPGPDRTAPAARHDTGADGPRPDPSLDDTAELPILTGDPADTMEFPVITIAPPRPGVRTGPGPGPAQDPGAAAVAAFDALYMRHAEALIRQAYLLTGRPRRAQEAVERAFRLAWQRWPEVAVAPDPVSWVRAASHEYALSPWHGLRAGSRAADRPTPTAPAPPPTGPDDRALLGALLELPAPYRRALVLHDGVGLGLGATAAEVEASTRAAAGRLAHARATVAERVPELELSGCSPERQGAILHDRLVALAATQPVAPPAAEVVRDGSDLSVRRLTHGVLGLSGLLAATTVFALVTAVWHEPPAPPAHPRATAPARPATAPGTHRPPRDAAGAPQGSPAPGTGPDGDPDGYGDAPSAENGDGSDAADDRGDAEDSGDPGDGKPVRPSPGGSHPGPQPAPGAAPSAAPQKGAAPRAVPPPGPAAPGSAPPWPAAPGPATPGPAAPRAVTPPAPHPAPPASPPTPAATSPTH
ncbi:hypothetical protein [Streptomyces sp. NPDC059080]|uniref:hypothetical protein n=1 Tax=Streptomyces sp. NPDC059080 TaxID=3346718 RepID=UPI0036B651EA